MRGGRRRVLRGCPQFMQRSLRASRQHSDQIRTAVSSHVLQRFVARIMVIRTVVVVMMRLVVEVHGHVREIDIVPRPRTVRHGVPVPQQREDQHEHGRRFTHGAQSSRAAACCRTPEGEELLRDVMTQDLFIASEDECVGAKSQRSVTTAAHAPTS